MKLQWTKLGFTLIELLVVITIIGILATGAVWVYTSQIQKARDTTRITDMSAMKWGLEQAFQDIWMYPGEAATVAATTDCWPSAAVDTSWVYCIVKLWFLASLPKDPKNTQNWNGSPLIYTYNYENVSWVINQAYEVSTWIESDWFKNSKAANTWDWWNDNMRIEFWTLKWKAADGSAIEINTCVNWTASCTDDSSDSSVWSPDSCTRIWTSIFIWWDCL